MIHHGLYLCYGSHQLLFWSKNCSSQFIGLIFICFTYSVHIFVFCIKKCCELWNALSVKYMFGFCLYIVYMYRLYCLYCICCLYCMCCLYCLYCIFCLYCLYLMYTCLCVCLCVCVCVRFSDHHSLFAQGLSHLLTTANMTQSPNPFVDIGSYHILDDRHAKCQ